jgi:hypothetical protein
MSSERELPRAPQASGVEISRGALWAADRLDGILDVLESPLSPRDLEEIRDDGKLEAHRGRAEDREPLVAVARNVGAADISKVHRREKRTRQKTHAPRFLLRPALVGVTSRP